jgi:hypothetical protein
MHDGGKYTFNITRKPRIYLRTASMQSDVGQYLIVSLESKDLYPFWPLTLDNLHMYALLISVCDGSFPICEQQYGHLLER